MARDSDVRALAFDVFGTTVDWCGSIAREAKAMLAPKGHALDWTAFANRWRREYQPAMEAVRSGNRGYVVLDGPKSTTALRRSSRSSPRT